ncbi:hypothetical protein WJX82_004127 [Trebouxia sp. C0006]
MDAQIAGTSVKQLTIACSGKFAADKSKKGVDRSQKSSRTSRDRLLWSCAKQLKPQLGTPTPHPFPPGISPTARGQSRHDGPTPHPQSSWLAFPGANHQQLLHDDCIIWAVQTAAAEGGQIGQVSQSPAVPGQNGGLTVGGAFHLLGLGLDGAGFGGTGLANTHGGAPSRLAKIRAIKVVLEARRGQGLRELQQCYERMQDVQRQLAVRQVALGPEGMGSRQPALMGVQGATWLGGTIGQKDSKHKGMQKPVADGGFKPPHKGGDAWTGSEYKMRLLSGLTTKLHAKLGLLALHHNRLSAQHCTRLLDQVEDRDRELLAQAGLQAFKSNATGFWVGQGKANALKAVHAKAKFRQKFQAWQHWAGKRCLLRDRLRLVLIACRRTTLVAGFAHWAVLVRSRKVRRAQRVMAGQWHLVRLHANILCAWRSQAHKLQVMRSKLVSQTQPLPAVSLTSRGDMLLRCQGMFAASLQQVHAATRELHNLQQFMRFHATREDMAWAAARASSTVHTFRAVKAQMSSPAKHSVPDLGCLDIRNASRSLVCHQVPLSLMHWHSLPQAEPFQELLGDIDHSLETDSTSTAILNQNMLAEELQAVARHSKTGSKVGKQLGSRKGDLPSSQAASKLQHVLAMAPVKHVEVPKERGRMPSDTPVRREARAADSSSKMDVMPSQMHAASPRSGAVHASMHDGRTLQAAAVSPRTAAVSPRAAAVSPRTAAVSPKAAATPPRATFMIPRAAAASPKLAVPRAAAASPRASPTARAMSARPHSASPKAAAKSRPAFVSATRSGSIVPPSQPAPHRPHSGHKHASTASATETVRTQLADHWPSSEHQAPAAQMDCHALVPQMKTYPVPLVHISHNAFSAGKNGMAEPSQDQQSHSSAYYCPPDCSQKVSEFSQVAADHLHAAVDHRHMATGYRHMAVGHGRMGTDMTVDHSHRATDHRHMAVHHCHVDTDHHRSDVSAQLAGKRQTSSARDGFTQQPDSVGSIAQLFMMRQRAKVVFQALAINVEQRRLQKRHAQQQQVPAMLRRCLRIWSQSALDTKEWLLQVRSPMLLACGFAAWCQHLKVKATRQQQLVYLQGRHRLVLMLSCFQAWRLRSRRQAFLAATVQHCRHRQFSHLLQHWQAWVHAKRSLRQRGAMVHRAHQGYTMRHAWRHWQWLASSKAVLVRVFECCKHSWELYDPRCEEYEQLLACLHSWKDRARHKRDKRTRVQQENCADAFRTTCMLLSGFQSFQHNHCQAVQLQCAMHSRDRLFAVWRRTVRSKVADWMHGPCLASTRRRLHLKGWVSEQQWHQQYQTRRLLSAGWTAFSNDITIPRRHRHHHLLRQAFTAVHAATAARAAQLGLFWQRWQVHFPLQLAMAGWRAVRVATARQRVKEAWAARARQCLLQRRAFAAWKAVVAVQYSQACKLQAAQGHCREQMLRRHWSAWLYVVGQQKRAVRQHRRCLMQAGFTALLHNAAAAQRYRAGAAATQLERMRPYWRSQTAAYATDNQQQVPVVGINSTQDALCGSQDHCNSMMLSKKSYIDNQENAHPWRQHPQSDRSNLMPDWYWLGPYESMDAKVECHVKPQTMDCLNHLRKQRTAM